MSCAVPLNSKNSYLLHASLWVINLYSEQFEVNCCNFLLIEKLLAHLDDIIVLFMMYNMHFAFNDNFFAPALSWDLELNFMIT